MAYCWGSTSWLAVKDDDSCTDPLAMSCFGAGSESLGVESWGLGVESWDGWDLGVESWDGWDLGAESWDGWGLGAESWAGCPRGSAGTGEAEELDSLSSQVDSRVVVVVCATRHPSVLSIEAMLLPCLCKRAGFGRDFPKC